MGPPDGRCTRQPVTDYSDPFDAAFGIAAAMEANRVDYAIGGALALGLWAVPRDTADVDLNVFVDPDHLVEVFEALEAAGVAVDRAEATARALRDGMFVGRAGLWRVDVFVASIPFQTEAKATRRRHEVEGRSAWFLSPEALAVFKLLFFRGKDIADLERLVGVQGAAMDVGYVRSHIAEMMGEDDERTTTWDRIVAAFGA